MSTALVTPGSSDLAVKPLDGQARIIITKADIVAEHFLVLAQVICDLGCASLLVGLEETMVRIEKLVS